MKSRLLLFALLLCGMCDPSAKGIQQEPPSLTIRTSTHMVMLDVLVKDRSGHSVPNLKAADFIILEEGKPQSIATFNAVDRRAQSAFEQPGLPEHVYTNRPEYHMPPGPLTVIVLDILNTKAQDQSYARGKLLKYIAGELKPDEPIAIYTLGNSLTLLQDFTSEPELLKIAIEAVNPKTSMELQMADVEKRLPRIHESGGTSPVTRARIMSTVNSLREFYNEQAEFELEVRISKTLAAFRMISRAVAGHPGRKNLMWVSGAFPLTITKTSVQYRADLSDPNRVEPMSQTSSSYSAEDSFRQTIALLAEAQVSVYPVDARGLVGSIVSDTSDSMVDPTGQFLTGADYAAAITNSSSKLLEDQQTMSKLAEETGGFVFKNRNDIDAAVPAVLADSGSYYEIGYYPANHNWNGAFRKIEVHVDRTDTDVRYRRGYFAFDPLRVSQSKRLIDTDISNYVSADAPAATMVVFDARVVPPSPAPTARVPIEFLVDMRSLSADESVPGTHEYEVDFHVAAFGPEGKPVDQRNIQLRAPVKADKYVVLMQTGLPFHTDLSLPPGQYRLRLVVRDERTGFLGSVDVPLVLERPLH
jgi:VWFA-related protein